MFGVGHGDDISHRQGRILPPLQLAIYVIADHFMTGLRTQFIGDARMPLLEHRDDSPLFGLLEGRRQALRLGFVILVTASTSTTSGRRHPDTGEMC
jgi:hypothetical protein